MKHSIALKEERASLITELEDLVNVASTEEREFTEDEETRKGDLNESIYALDAKITKAEKSEQILARNLAGAASESQEREMDGHAKSAKQPAISGEQSAPDIEAEEDDESNINSDEQDEYLECVPGQTNYQHFASNELDVDDTFSQ